MSKIKTLKKKTTIEGKKGINLGKLKLDFSLNVADLSDKIIKKCNPKIDITWQAKTIKELSDYVNGELGLTKFKFDFKEVSEETSKRIAFYILPKKFLKKEFLESDLFDAPVKSAKSMRVNIAFNDEFVFENPLYSTAGIKISKSANNSYFTRVAPHGDEEYTTSPCKVMDLNELVSICYAVETCYLYLKNDGSILNNSENTFYNEHYTEYDLENMLNLDFLTKRKIDVPLTTKMLICECVRLMRYEQSSLELTNEYKKSITSEYSKSFQTKKNIPQKLISVMENTKFLNYFSFVELDELTDLTQFRKLESEFIRISGDLKSNGFFEESSELRFRRLGNHKASGLYYPTMRCVCIDINSPSSFIHEMAHHYDVCRDVQLSHQADFRKVAMIYIDALNADADKSIIDSEVNYYKNKKSYFHTPTEIFARCTEMYLVITKDIQTSFLPEKERMIFVNGYPSASDKVMKAIDEYFSKIFNFENGSSFFVNNEDVIKTPLEEAQSNYVEAAKGDVLTQNIIQVVANTPPSTIFELLDDKEQPRCVYASKSKNRRKVKAKASASAKLSQMSMF